MTTTLHLTSDAQCSTCNGSGARPGTTPKLCPQCGGRGVIDDNQGLFSFSTPCRRCAGAGTVIEDPCPTCRGSGVEKRAREVQARIPAGVSDGQTIRLKGRGAPGRNGGPAGDLLVQIHVAAAPAVRPQRQRPHGPRARQLRRRRPRRRHRRADARRSAGHAAHQAGHPAGQPAPRAGQGHRHQEGYRRPHRHGRRGRADVAVRGRALGDRAARRGQRRPSRSRRHDPPPHPGRLRDLGRRRARRHAPPDAAHLRAPRPRAAGAHPGWQPPLQRRRHRGAAAHLRAAPSRA